MAELTLKTIRTILKKWKPAFIVFFVGILLWEILIRGFQVQEYIIPSPLRIGTAIKDNLNSLLNDTVITFFEAFFGFLIANVFAILIAIVFCYVKWAEKSFYPYIIALKSVPIVAMAPLLVIWFGYGYGSKIIMSAIVAFFPLVVNATLGLKSINKNYVDLMKTFAASEFKIFKFVRIPNAIPYIFSALKVSSTLAVVGAIIAEMTGSVNGIGARIMISSMNLDTPVLFASIIFASLIGILFFSTITIIEKYLT